jgi:hypothetical protein
VVGDELVIVALGAKGLVKLARNRLSTPGHPQIVDAHYPSHPGGNGPRAPRIKPKTEARSPSAPWCRRRRRPVAGGGGRRRRRPGAAVIESENSSHK